MQEAPAHASRHEDPCTIREPVITTDDDRPSRWVAGKGLEGGCFRGREAHSPASNNGGDGALSTGLSLCAPLEQHSDLHYYFLLGRRVVSDGGLNNSIFFGGIE